MEVMPDTVWIVRYWMPPERFLTFTACYKTEEDAIRGAWNECLQPMHQDGWLPVMHPASTYFPDDDLKSRAEGKVVAPTKGDEQPRALAIVTEEPVR